LPRLFQEFFLGYFSRKILRGFGGGAFAIKVLITGGAGFVGSHAAEYYAKKGDKVIVYDNLSRSELLGQEIDVLYNWNYLGKLENVELVKEDIRNMEALKQAMEGVEVVIHAAAQTAVTTSVEDPVTDFEVNALGTFNVLEAARLSGSNPTVIYCSTNKVYGENVNCIKVIEKETRYSFDEDFAKGVPESFAIDLCEHTPYGCSKLAGDLYVQDYGHLYGLKTAVFRMSCIYGTRQFGVEDQGWLAWLTFATLTDKPITIYGDGKQVRDVLFVSDLINAFDAFINSNHKQEVFNIGGGLFNSLSLIELLDLLEELTGKRSHISYDSWRPSDQKVYISDISRAKEELNWQPEIQPRAGVQRLVDWISNYVKEG
jgi:CDP-paratose 2-epimerase